MAGSWVGGKSTIRLGLAGISRGLSSFHRFAALNPGSGWDSKELSSPASRACGWQAYRASVPGQSANA
ncbi:MAG TPA: hypothetical protein DCY88_28065 [Cyanobacteria bacterium UBA11372]|nr:hypothetical protein [Cyanobacteria bacterium UBA11372]